MKKHNLKTSYWYLFAAALTQMASIFVLIFSLIFRKKKNILPTVLSILALEGGTSLLLLTHLHRDMATLSVSGEDEEVPAPVACEEEAPEADSAE